MSNIPIFLTTILLYVICSRFSLSRWSPHHKSRLFAAGNIVTFVWLSLLANFNEWQDTTILSLGTEAVVRHIGLIGCYVLTVACGFYLMRALTKRGGWSWLAFFYPIAVLILVKYLFPFWKPLLARLEWDDWVVTAAVIGLSYMAFRLSYLVLEVRNGTAEMPTLSEYLGFAFFLPTLVVGPINPFSIHQRSIESVGELSAATTGRCLLRILIGATKYLFLANLANQLSYTGIFLDGKPHATIDLLIAVIFYPLYLYCNFSGFCDMAIGVAGLIGVRVKENFNNPFAARNVKEFWNRWHITLSEYTRDVIFAPLSKFLIRNLGVKYANFSVAASVTVVFLVIGIWHGFGWHYAAFGLIHAVGIIVNHYYTIWLKRVLGKDGYKKYNGNPLINAAAVVLTLSYVAASYAVFANDRNMLGLIKNAVAAGF